jgi:hypothetical protein
VPAAAVAAWVVSLGGTANEPVLNVRQPQTVGQPVSADRERVAAVIVGEVKLSRCRSIAGFPR